MTPGEALRLLNRGFVKHRELESRLEAVEAIAVRRTFVGKNVFRMLPFKNYDYKYVSSIFVTKSKKMDKISGDKFMLRECDWLHASACGNCWSSPHQRLLGQRADGHYRGSSGCLHKQGVQSTTGKTSPFFAAFLSNELLDFSNPNGSALWFPKWE